MFLVLTGRVSKKRMLIDVSGMIIEDNASDGGAFLSVLGLPDRIEVCENLEDIRRMINFPIEGKK
jgi:hypothetical protein